MIGVCKLPAIFPLSYKFAYIKMAYNSTLSFIPTNQQTKMGSTTESNSYQNVVVLRHGDRLDNFNSLWTVSAQRPWDPPLVEEGKVRAFKTGQKIREDAGFTIRRVFVSPFLRCLETAAEAVKAICDVEGKSGDDLTSRDVVIDPSKIKVSIEYGLCEMLNNVAIRKDVAPKDGIFSFDISQCESVFPAGTIDSTVEQVYKELPQWQESVESAKARYCDIVKSLADKYPSENLLLVTHAEGVASVASKFVKDIDTVCKAEYCAYSQLRRRIDFGENQSFSAGEFVGSLEGQVGLSYKKPSVV